MIIVSKFGNYDGHHSLPTEINPTSVLAFAISLQGCGNIHYHILNIS